MHSASMAARLQLVRGVKGRQPVKEIVLSSESLGSRGRKQVAAVCFRRRKMKIEFLLVRTRKGRWTFPKGGVVAGLSRAHSAALEAFEEAGVHGRIEEAAFAHYVLRKRKAGQGAEVTTHAYLCEVQRLGMPQEPGRSPTWFSPEQAKASLTERRWSEDAREFTRVIDKAVSRIRRLSSQETAAVDPLQKVRFEAANRMRDHVIARIAMLPEPDGIPEKSRTADANYKTNSRRLLRLAAVNPTR